MDYKSLNKDLINLPIYYTTELTSIETDVISLANKENPYAVIKYEDILDWLYKKQSIKRRNRGENMKKILVFEEVVKFYHTITVDVDGEIKLREAIDSTENANELAEAYRIIDNHINTIGVAEDYYGKTKSLECIKVIDIDE